jgi:hypothetical protein
MALELTGGGGHVDGASRAAISNQFISIRTYHEITALFNRRAFIAGRRPRMFSPRAGKWKWPIAR